MSTEHKESSWYDFVEMKPSKATADSWYQDQQKPSVENINIGMQFSSSSNTTGNMTVEYTVDMNGAPTKEIKMDGMTYVRAPDLESLKFWLEERTDQALKAIADNEKLKEKNQKLQYATRKALAEKQVLEDGLRDVKEMIDRNSDSLIGKGNWLEIHQRIDHVLAAAVMARPVE